MSDSPINSNIAPNRNLEHWVCFSCRKMFKRPSYLENDGANPKSPVIAHKCPQCDEGMINMGLYFEPPPQRDLAAWQRMELLAEFGYFFYTDGSKSIIEKSIVGNPPLSPRELRRSLEIIREKNALYSQQTRHRQLQEYKRDRARLRRLK